MRNSRNSGCEAGGETRRASSLMAWDVKTASGQTRSFGHFGSSPVCSKADTAARFMSTRPRKRAAILRSAFPQHPQQIVAHAAVDAQRGGLRAREAHMLQHVDEIGDRHVVGQLGHGAFGDS